MSTGVASSTIREVAMMAQQKSGIRSSDKPVVRMVRIVTRKLMAPIRDEVPTSIAPRAHNVCPTGACKLSGA